MVSHAVDDEVNLYPGDVPGFKSNGFWMYQHIPIPDSMGALYMVEGDVEDGQSYTPQEQGGKVLNFQISYWHGKSISHIYNNNL